MLQSDEQNLGLSRQQTVAWHLMVLHLLYGYMVRLHVPMLPYGQAAKFQHRNWKPRVNQWYSKLAE